MGHADLSRTAIPVVGRRRGRWPRLRSVADDPGRPGHQHSQAVAHGRHSAEGGPRVECRRRLILTRRIAGLARDPQNSKALLWNPSGASFEDAWRALGAPDGALAVIGGTEVFGLFLEIGYDSF